jgi:hypothetical protein
MNPLKMVGGVSVQQAAELLNVPPSKVLQLVSSGLLESISFGSGGVDGITSESVTTLIGQQAEKDFFKRKTMERANKSWAVFERFIIDEGGSVRFSQLYSAYEKWTKREGVMTLSKVELGDYLVDLRGLQEDWDNAERVICGISLKAEAMSIRTTDPTSQNLLAWIEEKCIKADDATIPAAAAYQSFKDWWQKKNKDKPPSQKKFGTSMTMQGYDKDRGAGGGAVRYLGFGLRNI